MTCGLALFALVRPLAAANTGRVDRATGGRGRGAAAPALGASDHHRTGLTLQDHNQRNRVGERLVQSLGLPWPGSARGAARRARGGASRRTRSPPIITRSQRACCSWPSSRWDMTIGSRGLRTSCPRRGGLQFASRRRCPRSRRARARDLGGVRGARSSARCRRADEILGLARARSLVDAGPPIECRRAADRSPTAWRTSRAISPSKAQDELAERERLARSWGAWRRASRTSFETRWPPSSCASAWRLSTATFPPTSSRDLANAGEEIDRLDRLVNDLLTVAGRRHGPAPEIDSERSRGAARRADAGVRPTSTASTSRVTVEGTASSSMPTRSRVSMDNLMKNAIEASPTGTPSCAFEVSADGDGVHLRVHRSWQWGAATTASRRAIRAILHDENPEGVGSSVSRRHARSPLRMAVPSPYRASATRRSLSCGLRGQGA